MIDENVVEILNRYNEGIAEEISNINLAITRISDELKSCSDYLIGELLLYSKNTGIDNKDRELQLLSDSQYIREYISNIKLLDFDIRSHYNDYSGKTDISDNLSKEIAFNDVIVLNNTLKCDLNHNIHDINIIIPVLDKEGNVYTIKALASYCETCNRYTITKDVFNSIEGIVLCEVINKTNVSNGTGTDSQFEDMQYESTLYRYGYNVQSKKNLTSKQRHIIIAALVESGIMTRNQIMDHITTLINRGKQIPSWGDAVRKWNEDRYFTERYKTENLPNVIADRILLKYSYCGRLE